MVQLLDVLVARVADGLPSEVKAGVQGALTTLASHRLVSSLLHALGPAHGAEPAASRVAALRSSARSAGTHALAQPPSRLVAQALVHERAFDMAAAARCLESAVATSSDGWLETSEGVDALCRLAKQRSDSGWQSYAAHHGLPFCSAALPAPGALSLAEGAALIADSVALCDDALRLAPHSGRAHMAAAVATGRAALFTADLRARVRMCNRIRALAEQALVLDPTEDGAHHVLGRWHFEVASLNPVARALMRHALGGDTRASHADALAHYSAAAALAPSRLTHWSEHGKALVALGRPGEGALLLRTALGCDVEDVNAEVARVHAAALLQQLKAGRRDGGRAQRRAAQAERRVAARAARAARREEARGRREARRAARGSQRSAAAAV